MLNYGYIVTNSNMCKHSTKLILITLECNLYLALRKIFNKCLIV